MQRKRFALSIAWPTGLFARLIRVAHSWSSLRSNALFTLLILGGLLAVSLAGMSGSGSVIANSHVASSPTLQVTIPGSDTYRLISSIFSSGSSGVYAQSYHYRLASSFGEPALPNNQTDLMSQEYRHQPGFLMGVFGNDGGAEDHVYLPLVRR